MKFILSCLGKKHFCQSGSGVLPGTNECLKLSAQQNETEIK